MGISPRMRIEPAKRNLNIIGSSFTVYFVYLFYSTSSQVMIEYTTTNLGGNLLTLYSVVFGSLLVIFTLFVHRIEGIKDTRIRKESKDAANDILNLATLTLVLVLLNVTYSLTTYQPFYPYLFVLSQLIALPWLFTSIIRIFIQLREIFLLNL